MRDFWLWTLMVLSGAFILYCVIYVPWKERPRPVRRRATPPSRRSSSSSSSRSDDHYVYVPIDYGGSCGGSSGDGGSCGGGE